MRISDWSSDVCSSDLFHCLSSQVVGCSACTVAGGPTWVIARHVPAEHCVRQMTCARLRKRAGAQYCRAIGVAASRPPAPCARTTLKHGPRAMTEKDAPIKTPTEGGPFPSRTQIKHQSET